MTTVIGPPPGTSRPSATSVATSARSGDGSVGRSAVRSTPRVASADVETVAADTVRASVRVRGHVTALGVAPLAEAIDAHVRAGRRFLRISLAAVPDLDAEAVRLFERTHDLLLAQRGTLILTGVHGAVMDVLHRAGLDRVLFLLAPTADERTTSVG